ncbi:SDR family NAD(P)-dependent oxidoreductase [Paenibacillus macquariensis]|uniref:Phosphopantetheine attachment site n=1 Tax=Paenibacillus macquariensis TaxID=948756 RepID=A0ABY1K3A7_9BACL|nr:SDR family NAD(P)-dependent oxidoreductase [Paenibacillus macquariensis]MEC0090287.1 SDR family NAD(P)-dependent oxidoreductase [Paenibacillus macquariensis]OAB39647.1 hypothetical protein PMSM_00525 [Paenibacillus macquariensis subsp. macquariensis]SIR18848.1 Phosphopantetheine attachment site [Paenibacillus macquariensis]
MSTGDIAIIGIDITLPGCPNQDDVWNFLRNKRISKGKFPAQRREQLGLAAGENDLMDGSYLERIDQFDHKYFGISQKSADYMEPNQRLTLLSATKALNDSGYLDKIRGSITSVYASVNTTQQYQYLGLLQERQLKPDLLGMLNSTISSRINYIYDLKGPSFMTDTACSSSLVSVIQACNDLQQGIVDSAVVVSANVYVKPGFKNDKLVDILAEDAKTKTFDDRSTGTSMGEGVCSVILKRREDAEEDGDYIYGLIKSYAMNNDGQTMNMSSPNPLAQGSLIEQAWAPLEKDLKHIAFIEAHGTGTAVGDTIEFESLNNYFLSHDLHKQSVALTAGKSNFGHLDVASGLFSLIKSVLSLRNRTILPHPDFKIPNSEIDFEDSIFFIPDKYQVIEDNALAGVSSFGMTGTNAHVVLQRYDSDVEHPVKDLDFNLHAYWFPLESNSFAIKNELQRMENETTWFVQFPLSVNHNWEIKEHKFNKKHLLVGTSIFEMIAQGLRNTEYSLETYSVKNLHILNQLTVQEGAFSVLLALDKEQLKGNVTFTINETVKNWLEFELTIKQDLGCEQDSLQEDASMQEIVVTNQVGESDDEDINVSQRWDVVDKLWVNNDQTRAVVKLRVPPGYEQEFERYHFYPSILDPTFNALNRMAEPNDILFPWHWSEINFSTDRLRGTEFYSDIQLRDKTTDAIGNIILSLDIRLYDENKQQIMSVHNYKVKNALVGNKEEQQTFFKQQNFVPLQFEKHVKKSNKLIIMHESLRYKYSPSSPVLYFEHLSDLVEYDLEIVEIENVYLWDKSYDDESTIASQTYDLGQFLLRLNKERKLKSFHYITTGVFGYDGMNALNRSIAMGAYSLRLELNFAIIIIDTEGHKRSTDLMDFDFKQEDLIVHRNEGFHILRFKGLKLEPIVEPKWNASKLLIIGGTSGIGKQYMKYVVEQYPNIQVIVAGRKPAWSGEMLADNVQYVRLDITDEDQVKLFSATNGHQIHYILNFAGEPAKGLFMNKTRDDFCEKTKSKINGSYLLQKYFTEVYEIIHFSSLAGLIGAMGQTEYCAANAYQSGLAYTDKIRTLNLTGWEDVGMSAGKADYYFEKLYSDAGVKLIDRFIQSTIKEAFMFKLKNAADDYSSVFSKVIKVKTDSMSSYENKKDSPIESKIVNAWKNTLGEDEYDFFGSFFEQGGDSITIVHLCDELNKVFPGGFDVTTLFSIPTINGQIELIEKSLVQEEKQFHESDVHFDAKEMFDFLNK